MKHLKTICVMHVTSHAEYMKSHINTKDDRICFNIERDIERIYHELAYKNRSISVISYRKLVFQEASGMYILQKLQRRVFLSTSLHLIFLKHSCISVYPDQNCIAEWRNNGIKFSFCRCKYVLAQSVHAYNCCKTYFSSLMERAHML